MENMFDSNGREENDGLNNNIGNHDNKDTHNSDESHCDRSDELNDGRDDNDGDGRKDAHCSDSSSDDASNLTPDANDASDSSNPADASGPDTDAASADDEATPADDVAVVWGLETAVKTALPELVTLNSVITQLQARKVQVEAVLMEETLRDSRVNTSGITDESSDTSNQNSPPC